MSKKYLIVLFFMAFVGARHAVPLQGLPLLSDTAFAATQENGQPCPPECVTDSMEIITYYPSPYGYYEELRGDKIIVGDTDNSRINETDLPPSGTITFEPMLDDPDASDGSLYEGSLYYQGAIGGTKGKFRFYDGIDWQDLGGGGDYWKPSDVDSDNIYYSAGNVGIGVGASEAIGAKLQVSVGNISTSGLIIKGGASITNGVATYTFNYSGNPQYFTIPSGVSRITVTTYGASNSGLGGKAKATILVNPGEKLAIYVGGSNGYNGGSGGGGASDIRRDTNNDMSYNLEERIIVAGGGGGPGGVGGGPGGAGGGISGSAGGAGSGSGGGGGGGPNSGGGGGGCSCDNRGNGINGSLGQGGAGGPGLVPNWPLGGGGGGGGGYYGGGGGGSACCPGGGWTCFAGGAGGGGGSSYVTGTNTETIGGYWSGSGKVIIEISGSQLSSLTEWKDVAGQTLTMIDIGGNIGIGTSAPSVSLDVAVGKTTLADAWSTRSSLRFKENLYPIDNALDKLSSLQGVYFDYKDTHKHSLGLVAEEVGKAFPELVTYESNGQDAISLDYDKLGAVTIEAIKEQQREIEQLKEANRSQQKAIELLMAEKEIRE